MTGPPAARLPLPQAPPAPEPDPTTTGGPGWQRLHPRMLLIHPLVEVGRLSPALVGLVLSDRRPSAAVVYSAVTAGLAVLLAVLRWITTRYAIGDGQVLLRHGLLRRRTRSVPLDRVRTVDVTAHALHRLVGLARVVIGAGTSDRKGNDRLVLDGLAAGEAAGLRARLLHRAAAAGGTPAALPDARRAAADATAPASGPAGAPDGAEEELARLRPGWIRYAPFTLTGAVTGLALLALGWRVIGEGHLDPGRIAVLRAGATRLERWPLALDVAVVAGAVAAFVALASLAGYILSFWRFRLSRHPGGTLHVSRGLITTRATSIERRRLLGAELSEPLLLRWAGGARCLAISTGLRVGRGAEVGGEILLPPGPRAAAVAVGGAVLGDAAPFTARLITHPRAARRRRLVRAVAGAAPATAALVAAALTAGPWWLGALAVVPMAAAVPLGADRYRSLGHGVVDGYLVTRSGSLVRRRCAIRVDGIIGWNLRRSMLQRRLGLATLTATTAAGRQHYAVVDLALAQAVRLAAGARPGLLDDAG